MPVFGKMRHLQQRKSKINSGLGGCLSTIFYKGSNYCDFPFAFLFFCGAVKTAFHIQVEGKRGPRRPKMI